MRKRFQYPAHEDARTATLDTGHCHSARSPNGLRGCRSQGALNDGMLVLELSSGAAPFSAGAPPSLEAAAGPFKNPNHRLPQQPRLAAQPTAAAAVSIAASKSSVYAKRQRGQRNHRTKTAHAL